MGDSRLPPEYLALATARKKKKKDTAKNGTTQNEPLSPLASPVYRIYMRLTNWAAVFTPA